MTSKRTKAESDIDAPAPASLASEVFDLLLESSRKELEFLLAVFVKSSSKRALETVRAEAIKRGAYVANKPSRYQHCSHAMLDSFFSLLEEKDLLTADGICRRWHAASKHSNAGWLAQLSRPGAANWKWVRQLELRRLKLSQLSVKSIFIPKTLDIERMVPYVGQLSRSLTSLTCWEMHSLQSIEPLRSLQLRFLTVDSISSDAVQVLANSSSAQSLTSLSASFNRSDLSTLLRLPSLSSLLVPRLKHTDIDLVPTTSTSLTRLELLGGCDSAFIARLFPALRLPALNELKVACNPLTQMACRSIATLSALTSLTFFGMTEHCAGGIQALEKLSALRQLHLSFLPSSDVLAAVAKLTQIETLHFSGLGPAGPLASNVLRPLQQLSKLQTLDTSISLAPGMLRDLPSSLTSIKFSSVNQTAWDSVLDELRSNLPLLQKLRFHSVYRLAKFKKRVLAVRPQLVVESNI